MNYIFFNAFNSVVCLNPVPLRGKTLELNTERNHNPQFNMAIIWFYLSVKKIKFQMVEVIIQACYDHQNEPKNQKENNLTGIISSGAYLLWLSPEMQNTTSIFEPRCTQKSPQQTKDNCCQTIYRRVVRGL